MPFRKKDSPFWQYDRTITVGGERYRIRGSTGERNKSAAREVEEAEVRAARIRLMHGDTSRQLTLDEAIGTYCANVAMHQPSWRTTKYQAKILLSCLRKKTALATIDNQTLTAHITRRRATVSNATVNRELQLLRRVITYADRNLNARVPAIDWRALHLSEPKGRVREMTAEEEVRLFQHLREDMKPLVRFCLATGCRVGSAIALEWRDVDFSNRMIVFRTMKGGEHHAVPMTDALLVLLANQPHVTAIPQVFTYLFRNNKRGKRRPFTQSGWNKPWKKALANAGIPDFRFHDLRHTALSRITRTNGIVAAQALAGHADISTTARYAHVQMDDLRKAMETAESSHTEPTRKISK